MRKYVPKPKRNCTLKQGFWFASIDSPSLDGILQQHSTVTGFLQNSPTARTFTWPAAQVSEKDKMLKTLTYLNGDCILAHSIYVLPLSRYENVESEIIGYTAYLNSAIVKGLNGNAIVFYINSDNMVYSMILPMSDLSSDPAPAWDEENWPRQCGTH